MYARHLHPSVLPQLIVAILVLMILCKLIIMSESRTRRREPLRRVIAFWIGFSIVGIQRVYAKISK